MTARTPRTRRRLFLASAIATTTICLLPAAPAFAAEQLLPASESVSQAVFAADPSVDVATAALAATPWVTTGAVDQHGDTVALDDPRAANFVGNAYFMADGTYTMYNLPDDSLKLRGDWDMRIVDGQLVRWINAKNAEGAVLFQRTVPIVQLDGAFFTYRVVNAEDPSQWVDIVHEPTDYAEPGSIDLAAATAALAATPWVTTGAVDQHGDTVALDDPRAANFVGNAYFTADGTFTMYNLDDSPKMHGDWDMRVVDGALSRWIAAKNDAGAVLFQRVVPIVQLDGAFFTYRVVNAEDPSQWVDIVHEPTDHAEPGANGGGGDPENPGGENPGGENPGGENPGTETPGEQPGTDRPGAEQPQGGTPAGAQNPGKLALTGAGAPIAAIVSSVLAVLGGLGLVVGRALRRAGRLG